MLVDEGSSVSVIDPLSKAVFCVVAKFELVGLFAALSLLVVLVAVGMEGAILGDASLCLVSVTSDSCTPGFTVAEIKIRHYSKITMLCK